MGTLGDRFRRARELQGVALSEIAGKTHIGARQLQAIEEEDYGRLPGGLFNKSFIRQYAECLGLDEEQAVRDYLRATAARETQQATAPEPVSFANDHSRATTWVTIAALIFTAAGLGGYLVHRRASSPPHAANSKPSASASAPLSAELTPQATANPATRPVLNSKRLSEPLSTPAELGPVNAEGEPIQQLSQSDPAPLSLAGPLPRSTAASQAAGQPSILASADSAASGELLLQINAHSSVWISVTADGEKKWQGTLQANQSRQVEATDTIRLTAGNAGGVSLVLNGKDIGAMGSEGEVKTVTLAARALGEPVP